MPKKPEILETKIVAKSRLFRIEELHLRFSNQEERHFERIQGWAKGSVMVVPILDEERFLLIREYATGLDQYVLVFPKGVIEGDEAPDVSANRELKEEVGYGARDIQPLTSLATSPGYMTSKVQVMIARDLYEERLPGDEPEPLEVVTWRFDEIDRLLEHPEFCEGRSVAALLLVHRQWEQSR